MPTFGVVLVADDEPELLSALCDGLTAAGYDVTGAPSGAAAVERMKERDFDILLTDLMMPGMDGIALLTEALKLDPHVVGVVMTGQGTVQTAVEAMKTGAFDYVLKPFKLGTLLPVMTRAMDVRRLRLENLQLRQSVAIYELGRAIAYTLDINTILYKLLDSALEQCAADEASVMIPTDAGDELYVAAVRGYGRERIMGERVAIPSGIAGWVARHREPLILQGAVSDPRFSPVAPRAEIRSSISLPMLAGGRLAGVLNVNATRPRRPFSLGDIKGLNILTSIAAPAMENCRLYERVKDSEENYRTLFDNAGDAIFIRETSGKFIEVNDVACERLGYARPELLAMTPRDLDDPDTVVDMEHRTVAIMAKGSALFETVHMARDGRRIPVEISSRLINYKKGQAILSIARDVTERKRAEDERKKLEEQLVQSQKMEAIGKLAGGVAHDFNNILSIIISSAGFIAEGLSEADPRRTDAEEVIKAGRRAAELTRQLLAFSRKQVLEPRVLCLNDTLKGIHKMLQRVIGEDVELVTCQGEAIWTVKADPGQMEQVIVNLAVNARDAMPGGGKLTIETKNVELDGEYAGTHEGVVPGPHVMVAVSDNGCGMDKETQARIFEPFFTTKGVGKGTGLGLSTVYGIVKQSGGSIFVYSEAGRGTSFKIYLPKSGEEAEASRVDSGSPVPSGIETVLLVEDEEPVRRVAREILRRKGYTVIETRDTEEAETICRTREGVIDLLLTDVVMPKTGGRELAKKLSPMRPGMKVLFMSGYTDDAVVRHGVLDEGTAFIQKPFNPETLARKVREVLDG